MHCKFDIAGRERGQISPLLYWGLSHMIDKREVKNIADDYLGEGKLFLVSVRVSTQNRIMILIDGDQGVTISDCVKLSRHLESSLDREKEDFELQVSSVGVGQPLQLIRQYRNNQGRRLEVKDPQGEKQGGKLVEVSEEGIWLEKDKAQKGKKKKKEIETDAGDKIFIPFAQIAEARVQVSFK